MKRRAVTAAALMAAAAWPTGARADLERPEHAISIGVLSLEALSAVAGQYERHMLQRTASWIAGGGVRRAGGDDFGGVGLSVSGEYRYWTRGRAIWSDLPEHSMIGWFLGLRLDAAWTHTTDRVRDESIGDNLGLALTGTFGYRFVIRRRIELSPMVGLGRHTDFDLRGRLPHDGRWVGRFGLTAGWLF